MAVQVDNGCGRPHGAVRGALGHWGICGATDERSADDMQASCAIELIHFVDARPQVRRGGMGRRLAWLECGHCNFESRQAF